MKKEKKLWKEKEMYDNILVLLIFFLCWDQIVYIVQMTTNNDKCQLSKYITITKYTYLITLLQIKPNFLVMFTVT